MQILNKSHIINDSIYGHIMLSDALIYEVVNHVHVQRLRRVSQLGLAVFVYPGAVHSRFSHALGTMHLSFKAVECLRYKHVEISNKERQALALALLLHDVGHSPFSHTLEYNLKKNIPHETLSLGIMEQLNRAFNGQLTLAIKMFKGTYHRKFFNQLISSQLDLDRLDYLKRDAFYTGVVEGAVGSNHIIKMMNVRDDQLVIEKNGLYSVESFLSARRLMYWQVYMHKTVVSMEKMLEKIMLRAKYLLHAGEDISVQEPLKIFLNQEVQLNDFENDSTFYSAFMALDDVDIMFAIKHWQKNKDAILSWLCQQFLERKLFKIQVSSHPAKDYQVEKIKDFIQYHTHRKEEELHFYYDKGELYNTAYLSNKEIIFISTGGGTIKDIAEVADLPNIKAMREVVKKHYICWPKQFK